jgi:MoaA/NifB/PqqE/SkfB family radical SAM enzyme
MTSLEMDNYFETERVYWKLFGLKLISYKRLGDGQIISTGMLNPIINVFRLFIMLVLQARFYRQYEHLGTWKGKQVANSFAPPVGSRPQFRALKGLIKTHLYGRAFPVAMTFAVTYRCQCNCSHCSAGDHLKSDIHELSTKEAKELIDESQDLGVVIIAFTGGEPLLRKDIYELISYVNQNKAMPLLFTNGLLLTDENVERLAEAGLYSLFVSLDSPDLVEHDRLRGVPGLFETALQGMKKMKSKGVFVGISSYATRTGTSKGLYKKMHQLAIELGVHNLLLFDCVPTGKLLKDTSEVLTREQREEIYEYSAGVFKNRIIPPISSQSWQNSLEAYLAGIGCLAGNIQYYVSAYGEVAPCDFAPLSFGNIRREPLKSIWKKIVDHPAYDHRAQFCRMQHYRFRHYYIDPIPDGATLPYPIEKLPRIDYLKPNLH